MKKPDVDSIEGLSPAISIDQKTTSNNPRSTVGTVTEIYDYLRLIYARLGVPHCPICGRVIQKQTVDQIVDNIMELKEGTRIQILAPVVRGAKGEHKKVIENIRKEGFVRVIVDGTQYDLSTDEINLNKNELHDIYIIVDRLIMKKSIENRVSESTEIALKYGNGTMYIDIIKGDTLIYSSNYACPVHNIGFEEISPRIFSFNNPFRCMS